MGSGTISNLGSLRLMIIDLAKDFSPYPSGRFKDDGEFNGARFRDSVLVPALQEARGSRNKVIVDIDGVRTFGSSFLEEAFAGLIRLGKFDRKDVNALLEVRCTKPHLLFFKDTISSYIENAVRDKKPAHH